MRPFCRNIVLFVEQILHVLERRGALESHQHQSRRNRAHNRGNQERDNIRIKSDG